MGKGLLETAHYMRGNSGAVVGPWGGLPPALPASLAASASADSGTTLRLRVQ